MRQKGSCNNCKKVHKACTKKVPCARCIQYGLEDTCEVIMPSPRRKEEKSEESEEIEDDNSTKSNSTLEKNSPRKKNKRKKRKNFTPPKKRSTLLRQAAILNQQIANGEIPLKAMDLPFPITTKFRLMNELEDEEIVEEFEEDAEDLLPPDDTKTPVVDYSKLPAIVYHEVELDQDYLKLVAATKGNEPQWERPASYIVHQEKTTDELDEMVEYDMDSEDEIWLKDFNEEIRKKGVHVLSEDTFERLIDRLEKESFLQDSLQAPPFAVDIDVENTNCCICMDGTSDDTNQIVFCDGCDIAVHQDCYGIRMIPEGLWFCAKCEAREEVVKCELCPSSKGAFKKTTEGEWCHVMCANWMPGVSFETKEGGVRSDIIIGSIPKQNRKIICEVCQRKEGACIQCRVPSCTSGFHVSCGYAAGFKMEVFDEVRKRANCAKHSHKKIKKKKLKQILDFEIGDGSNDFEAKDKEIRRRRKKQTPAKKKKFLEVFAHEMVTLAQAEKVLKGIHTSVIHAIWDYWVQKRKGRSGNPLIKRLTKNIIYSPRELILKKGSSESDKELFEIYQKMFLLRKDLEKARILLELCKKREKQKREKILAERLLFELQTDPIKPSLRFFLNFFDREDREGYFREDVNLELYPDYLQSIKQTMSFKSISHRIENENVSIDDFWEYITIVFENAMAYNPPLHPVHKEAKRLLKIAEDIKEQIKLSPDYGGDHIGPPKPIIFSSAFDPAPNEETILDEAIPDSPLLDIEPIAEDGTPFVVASATRTRSRSPSPVPVGKKNKRRKSAESAELVQQLITSYLAMSDSDDEPKKTVKKRKTDKSVEKTPEKSTTKSSPSKNNSPSKMEESPKKEKGKRGRKKKVVEVKEIPIAKSPVKSTPEKAKKKKRTEEEFSAQLAEVLVRLQKTDRELIFLDEVQDDLVPGYSDVIKNPMALRTMENKLKNGDYDSIDQFKDDFHLMITNAHIFNIPGSFVYKEASRLLWIGDKLIDRVKDDSLYTDMEELICTTCSQTKDPTKMLSCDVCDRHFHNYCLKNPLKRIPNGEWYCSDCDPSKRCNICNDDSNDSSIISCGACVRGYHTNCLDLPKKSPTKGKWLCPNCTDLQPHKVSAPSRPVSSPKSSSRQTNGISSSTKNNKKEVVPLIKRRKHLFSDSDSDPDIALAKQLSLQDSISIEGMVIQERTPPKKSGTSPKQKVEDSPESDDGVKKRLSFTARRRKNQPSSSPGSPQSSRGSSDSDDDSSSESDEDEEIEDL